MCAGAYVEHYVSVVLLVQMLKILQMLQILHMLRNTLTLNCASAVHRYLLLSIDVVNSAHGFRQKPAREIYFDQNNQLSIASFNSFNHCQILQLFLFDKSICKRKKLYSIYFVNFAHCLRKFGWNRSNVFLDLCPAKVYTSCVFKLWWMERTKVCAKNKAQLSASSCV